MSEIDQKQYCHFLLDLMAKEGEIAPARSRIAYVATLAAMRERVYDLRRKKSNDLQEIMSGLPHLRMEDGWELRNRMVGDGLGLGRFSSFYAHSVSSSSLRIARRRKGMELEDDESLDVLKPGAETNLFKHIQLDGTKESFWEAFLLRFASSQFHLWWHANYSRKWIVTSAQTFKQEIMKCEQVNKKDVYRQFAKWCESVRESKLRKALRNFRPIPNGERERLLPKVSLTEDGAVVNCAWFSPFEGLCLMQLKCKRDPFAIVESTRCGGFMYNCGVRY